MIHRRPFHLIVAFVLIPFCLMPVALGQSATATLSGSVQDEKGAVIPGASVMAVNIATRLERRATTNVTVHGVTGSNDGAA